MENNTKTAELVKKEIKSSLFINEILKRGFINYSALTRNLLPKIQKNNKKAKFPSVLIAIQRYYDEIKLNPAQGNFSDILKNAELIMKNKIVSLTLERTKDALNFIAKLSKKIRWDLGDILFTTQGSGEVTIVLDKKNSKIIEKSKLKIIERETGLSIISLRESEELKKYSKNVTGFLALLTTTLSDNKINIYDIASTYKQIIFVVSEKDLTMTYDVLNNMINYCSSPKTIKNTSILNI